MVSATHWGDVQTKLLTNVHTVILGVLSWLLPVITLVGIIFAVSLCFSGLAPLWATKAATLTLLSACVTLILLINAAYQQGDDERPVHVVLKLTVRLTSILLLIFAILAAVSLYLRIKQYGFTTERVLALIGVIISVLFGIGYNIVALPSKQWMPGIGKINIGLAIFNVLLLLAILTPIADPTRLSVISQVKRLQNGVVTIEKFDWSFLRY